MTSPVWQAAPHPLVLGPDDVHVWRVSLDVASGLASRLQATLSPDERARASRLRQAHHRDHFTASRGAQRDILARYTGRAAAELGFAYGSKGKPSLVSDGGPDLRFNISNSGALALCAVALGRDVGVDVECLRPVPRAFRLAEGYFSEREVRSLRSLPEELVERAFLTCWTRKEAFVKAAGTGLSLVLDCFDVGFAPGEPARLLATRPPAPDASQWSLHALEPGDGYVGALVVEAGDVALRCFDWSPLLAG